MPSKRNSKATPAPVAPTPQAKAVVAPPAPQVVRKQSATQQQSTVKKVQPQVAEPVIPITQKQATLTRKNSNPVVEKRRSIVQEQFEILTILMDAGSDWKPRNKGRFIKPTYFVYPL
jgi:hypothetical protein